MADTFETFDTGLLPLTSTEEFCMRDAEEPTCEAPTMLERRPDAAALLAVLDRVLPIALGLVERRLPMLEPPVALNTLACRCDPLGPPWRLITAESIVEPMREAAGREATPLLAMLLPTALLLLVLLRVDWMPD